VSGPLVSIIVVLYNSAGYIAPCVEALSGLTYRPLELIMVDNASSDGSAGLARRALEEAGLEASMSIAPRNRGFAAANNHGVSLSSGDILLFLNPDTEAYSDMVEAVVQAMEDDGRIGIAGCKLYYPDRKTLQHVGGYIRDNGLTMHYGFDEEDTGQHDSITDVTYVTGAALAARRDLFAEVGMFDEGYYPAYFEETDLCFSVLRQGYRVVCVPGARLVHHESTTTGRFTKRYYYLYHKNRVRFMLKNFPWDFLLEKALPMEQRWLGMIQPWEQAVPLNRAYLANVANLPRTLAARRKVRRRLGPLPDGLTVGHL
jgi:GT2 family glycosyltransferase